MSDSRAGTRFSNLKIRAKLALGFATVLFLTVVITVAGVVGLESIQDNADKSSLTIDLVNNLNKARLNRTVYEFTFNKQNLINNIEALNKMSETSGILQQKFKWTAGDKDKLHAIDRDIQGMKEQRDIFAKVRDKKGELEKQLDSSELYGISGRLVKLARNGLLKAELSSPVAYMSFDLNDADTLITTFKLTPNDKTAQGVREHLTSYIDDAKTLLPQLPQNQQPEIQNAITIMARVIATINDYNAVVRQLEIESAQMTVKANALATSVTDMFDYQKATAEKYIVSAEWQMVIPALIGIALSLLIGWGITVSITKPLNQTLAVAEQIAKGDLTGSLATQRRDEVGQLMQSVDAMNQNLKNIIHDVRDGVNNVARASAEIAAGNMDLSSRTEEQSAAVVETAASMEEISSTVKQNADNAHHARQLAEEASKNANNGGKAVEQVISTMKEIRESSQRISEIISVINGIAFQTNILALNAAVEAARAGEQGRGFAVVAGEVRSLAQRSSQSAKEIESLIKDSVSKVDSGFVLVESTGKVMEDTVRSVIQVRDIMGEIAAATDEQSRGVAQIGQAITEMDTTTQQNAALVEESSAAASSMEEQARQLEQTVSVFKLPGNSMLAGQKMSMTTQKASLKTSSQKSTLKRPALSATPKVEPRATTKPSNDDWESF